MDSKKTVQLVCIIEDVYVIVMVLLVLLGKISLFPNVLVYFLMACSVIGLIYLVITGIKDRQLKGYLLSTCILIVLANLDIVFGL